jgi:uncharacterized protein YsxB (DUF464 family)
MEITSFVLGMLTIVGITLVILVVLGIVKIYKQKEHLNQLEQTIHRLSDNASDWVMQLEQQMCRNFDDLRREYSSYVDSRIDKLQSKKEVPIK